MRISATSFGFPTSWLFWLFKIEFSGLINLTLTDRLSHYLLIFFLSDQNNMLNLLKVGHYLQLLLQKSFSYNPVPQTYKYHYYQKPN
jgi:hypothetical protein